MPADTRRRDAAIDWKALKIAATLLLGGQFLYIVVTQFHIGGEANDHASIFPDYAASAIWEAVHAGQFAGTALLVAGLVVLFSALDAAAPSARWPVRLGTAAAVVALALYGVLQAVDGIANKQVSRAWVVAGDPAETARFAAAEGMRWLEWGARSYFDFALGGALLLAATAVARSNALARPVPYLMGLSGLAYLLQGWVVGRDGFSGTHTTLILVAWILSLAWMIWLVVSAWRAASAPRPAVIDDGYRAVGA